MQGFKRMNPFCIPFAITNMPGAILAMDLGFMGPNYSISTACATGNYCILRWEGETHLTVAFIRRQCAIKLMASMDRPMFASQTVGLVSRL